MTPEQEQLEAYKMWHPYKYKLAFGLALFEYWTKPKSWWVWVKTQGLRLDCKRLKWKLNRLQKATK
jgi:hypothetical protein